MQAVISLYRDVDVSRIRIVLLPHPFHFQDSEEARSDRIAPLIPIAAHGPDKA